MKRFGLLRLMGLLAVLLLTTVAVLGCAAPAAPTQSPQPGQPSPTATGPVQKVIWRANSITPPGYVPNRPQYYDPVIKEVFNKTGGRLEVQTHWNNELGFGANEWPKILKESLVEVTDLPIMQGMGFIPAFGYEALPLHLGPPFSNSLTVKVSQGRRQFYDQIVDQWNGIRLNSFYLIPAVSVGGEISASKPFRSVADFKGAVMRNSTPAAGSFWANFGIKTVITTMPEIYLGFKTGMFELANLGRGAYIDYKLNEVAKYIIVYYPSRATLTSFGWAATKPAMAKLPPDMQKIVKDAYQKLQDILDAAAIDPNYKSPDDQAVDQIIKDSGIQIITLSEADQAILQQTADQTVAKWLANADELGRSLYKSDMTALGRPERYDQMLAYGKQLLGIK